MNTATRENPEQYDCDVLIVGTGAAGLYCALSLPERLQIQLITKSAAEESDSFLAQGGICVLRGEEDYDSFFEDTLNAGHRENDRRAVDLMIRASNAVIRDLTKRGVRFDTEKDGTPAYTREGAHSRPRILYHEDVTGRELTSTLLEQVRTLPNVRLRERVTMLDLLTDGQTCGGLLAANERGETEVLRAPHTVLCCGGLGGLYDNTTNFPHITGDALAIALRRGVALQNLNYIQIHPTTLYDEKPGRRFLISESVRGEGAQLYNRAGERFVDELLPRDKLTEAIFAQMEKDGSHWVWEDMRPIGKDTILAHFPNIYEHCSKCGFDVLRERIPVVPAQHYFMGGIRVNLASQTSLRGLYACGETSCNGVHGRNRLASNSLLESLVFAARAAEDIVFGGRHRGGAVPAPADLSAYDDRDALFAGYRASVLNEIQRLRDGENGRKDEGQ